MPFYPSQIRYSDKYTVGEFEYTSVILPKSYLPKVQGRKILSYKQIKDLDVTISPEWENYVVHEPEPHVILLRRPFKNQIKSK